MGQRNRQARIPPRTLTGLSAARGGISELAILPVLALSAFLQFFDLDDRQLFLGDQALHAQVAHDIVLHGLRPLVGPPLAALSGTNMGPIFYYISALPVWLSGGWPTGGAVLVGLFQVATVYLLYRLGRTSCGSAFGLTAASLYATSGVVIYWHRMLWPNMVPFCAAMVLWTLLVLGQRPGARRAGGALVMLMAALAVAIQLQPTAFLLVPVAVGGWLLARPRRPAPWALATAAAITVVLVSPLIVNEATTGLSQTRAWLGYLHQTGHAATGSLRDALVLMGREYRGLLGLQVTALLAVLGGASLFALLWAARPRHQPAAPAVLLARLCLLWGALYSAALLVGHTQIYPHYFIPLFPLPFLALAYVVQPLWRRRATAVLAAISILSLATWNTVGALDRGFSLDRAALLDPSDVQTANVMLGTLRQVTRVIAGQIGTTPYNFELLSPSDYPTDYKYLLRLEGALPSHAPVRRKAVIVQPAYLPPAAWPGWVTDGLAGSTPRFWLFDHVALWAWDAGGRSPLSVHPGTAPGQQAATHLVTALALGRDGAVWSGSPAGVIVFPAGGKSWKAPAALRPDGAPDQPAALLLDPRQPHRAYAATASGVYITDDAGKTWHGILTCRGRIFALLAPSATLRLAGGERGLCVSRDGGSTWRRQVVVTAAATANWERAHPQPIYALWQAPSGEVLAGAATGLLVSPDGELWRHLPHGLDVGITTLLAFPGHPPQSIEPWGTSGAPLFAGTASGVLRSSSGGQTWQRLDAGLGNPYVFGLLATASGQGQIVWAATATGLFRLTPGDARWALVDGGWPRDAAALSLAGDGQRIVVGTDSGLYRSQDSGRSWAAIGP